MHGAAFAWRGAADHLGAVGNGLLGMEGPVLAGEALADDFGALVDEDTHVCLSASTDSVHLPLKGGGRRASAGWGSTLVISTRKSSLQSLQVRRRGSP